MKKLIMCLMLCASPAIAADRKTFGSWVVLTQESGLNRSCVAGVAAGKSEFRFLIDDRSDLVLRFRIDGLDLTTHQKVTVGLKVDDNASVSIPAVADRNVVQVSLPRNQVSQALTKQILDGNTLSLLGNLGQTAASFSLRGSGQALAALMGCQIT